MSSEFDDEPVAGLPGTLPPGEHVLWQGRPSWRALAREIFHVRWLALYFALFGAMRFALAVREHQGVRGAFALLGLAGLAAGCLALLALLAWLNARATIYTITTRRVVLRIGVAIPTTWNLPFKRLASADVNLRPQGDGDIVLKLAEPDRIAWVHLWPHTQPWKLANARPALRAIAEPARVALILREAVARWAVAESAPVIVASNDVYAPSPSSGAAVDTPPTPTPTARPSLAAGRPLG
jgi:Bacterial PH domain